MANKELGNLYGYVSIDNDEILTETPLNIITEKDILKYNYIFSSLTKRVGSGGDQFITTMSTGFNSLIYELFMDKFDNEDKAFNKTKEFEVFLNSLVLNTKIYYRGKEMSYPEFINHRDDKSSESMMKFNICFFLSTFIVFSNTIKLETKEKLTIIQEGLCYTGSSTLGEFHSYVQNLKTDLYSVKE